jgi:NhaP-type Na+/H+ or K+/H+ antiporter
MGAFVDFFVQKAGWIMLGLILGFTSGYMVRGCEKPHAAVVR